jgi:hypothetical protein
MSGALESANIEPPDGTECGHSELPRQMRHPQRSVALALVGLMPCLSVWLPGDGRPAAAAGIAGPQTRRAAVGGGCRPPLPLQLRGGGAGRRRTRSTGRAVEDVGDTQPGGAPIGSAQAAFTLPSNDPPLAQPRRGRRAPDLARSDSPRPLGFDSNPLGMPPLQNDPPPSYFDGGVGGFSQYGDTEGGEARAWERHSGADDSAAGGGDSACGEEGQTRTIAQVLDELGITKPHKPRKPEHGHAPDIAREMGLSDPSEDNPDANQVMDLVRFAQEHSRISSWGGWTSLDTNRLYWGVRYFGSDFDTMQQALFQNRTRKEIKRKFTGDSLRARLFCRTRHLWWVSGQRNV